jgi:uncharacterized protein HemY
MASRLLMCSNARAASLQPRLTRTAPLQWRTRERRRQGMFLQSAAERARVKAASIASLQEILRKDPTDPRVYVTLGTLLMRELRYEEAREVYADGCRMAQGTNEYVWAAMANLERKARARGVRQARAGCQCLWPAITAHECSVPRACRHRHANCHTCMHRQRSED